MRSLIKRR